MALQLARFCTFLATALALGACGNPTVAFLGRAQPQSNSSAMRTARGGSWMLPEAKKQNLLYYSGFTDSSKFVYVTYVLTYPQGKLVGVLNRGGSLCSDGTGNIWMANGNKSDLVEYAHGGTKPIKIIDVKNMRPLGCAVDPATGNLAVISGAREVDVYSGASLSQTLPINVYPATCTYDGSGNLFVLGNSLSDSLEVAELPKGAERFERLRGYHTDYYFPGAIRWDGKYVTIGTGMLATPYVVRYAVRAKHLRAQGQLYFNELVNIADYWIVGSKVVVANLSGGGGGYVPIYLYNYPMGGNPIKAIGQGLVPLLDGESVTVSLAQ